jgi:hypothetical protein
LTTWQHRCQSEDLSDGRGPFEAFRDSIRGSRLILPRAARGGLPVGTRSTREANEAPPVSAAVEFSTMLISFGEVIYRVHGTIVLRAGAGRIRNNLYFGPQIDLGMTDDTLTGAVRPVTGRALIRRDMVRGPGNEGGWSAKNASTPPNPVLAPLLQSDGQLLGFGCCARNLGKMTSR